MQLFSALCVLAVILIGTTAAHMEMKYPAPRRSKFNTNIDYTTIDYDNTSPLAADGSNFPCKKYQAGAITAKLKAGQTITATMAGGAPHGGGHCEYAVSYDGGRTFVVLKTIIRDCMVNGQLNHDVPLPSNLPACDSCIFAWTWVNAIGNREYYMNCADVSIESSNVGGSFTGPALTIANLPGYPTIGEFPKRSDPDGAEVFRHGRTVTVFGPQSTSSSKSTAAYVPSAGSSSSSSSGADDQPSSTADSSDQSKKKKKKKKKNKGKEASAAMTDKAVVDNEEDAATSSPPTANAATGGANTATGGSCQAGQMVCNGDAEFRMCLPTASPGVWQFGPPMKCATGTRCQANGNSIICGY